MYRIYHQSSIYNDSTFVVTNPSVDVEADDFEVRDGVLSLILNDETVHMFANGYWRRLEKIEDSKDEVSG
jgi:hypothetical protein